MEHVEATIRPAESAEELRAVQGFKYRIYVEEMQRYADIADHENRLLVEDDDATSRNFLIEAGGDLAGVVRLTWGGDAGAIRERQIMQYDLAPFLEHITADQFVICERLMILPRYRGTDLLMQIFGMMMGFCNTRRIQLFFGDSEPHLINTYLALGFRTYTENHVNSPATGFLIPLVIVIEDLEYLRRVGSPLVSSLTEFADDAQVPGNIDMLIAGGAAVQTQAMSTTEDYIARIKTAAETAGALQTGLFAGMTEDEIVTCVGKSLLISCARGDRVIKEGNVAKNMSLVLTGDFEVIAREKSVASLGPGDVFGEIAFFLKTPRTADVVAVSEHAQIISFNDRTMRQLIENDATIAAKLLFNISTLLCARLDHMNKIA